MTKIKPEAYGKILQGLTLKNIYLKGFEGGVNLDAIPQAATIDIKSTAKYTKRPENQIQVVQDWSIVAKDKTSKSKCLSMSVSYGVLLHSQQNFTKSFFEVYEKTSLPLNVWPFVREFVNSMTARMNIPPLTLPLLKFMPKRA